MQNKVPVARIVLERENIKTSHFFKNFNHGTDLVSLARAVDTWVLGRYCFING